LDYTRFPALTSAANPITLDTSGILIYSQSMSKLPRSQYLPGAQSAARRCTLGLILLITAIGMACSTFSTPLPSQPTVATPTSALVFATPTPQPTPAQAADQQPIITPTAPPAPTSLPAPAQETHIEVGDKALGLGNFETALAAYEQASVSADSESRASALLGLGRTYLQLDDTDNALKYLRELLDQYPQTRQSAKANFALAQTYEQIDRTEDAAEYYLAYLTEQPGILDAYIYEKRGDLLSANGNFSLAQIEYQAALNSPRLLNDFELEIKLARSYAYIGDYGTALVMYDDIAARTTSDYIKAQMGYLKGIALSAQGDTAGAQAIYLEMINNYPAAYDSYLALVELVNAGYAVDELQRGIVDYFAGEYVAALAALDRYLSAAPTDPARAYYYKGLCLRAQNNPAAAIETWDIAIVGYPASPVIDRVYEQKAYTQWAFLDQYPEARQTLVDFVDAQPNHARAAEFLFDAAQISERNANLADAVALWERIPVDFPQSAYNFNALIQAGLGEYRQGNFQAAQAIFLRAQANSANIAETSAALFWVAKTYQQLGDRPAAEQFWQAAASTDPTGYYSERALDILANRPPFDPPMAFDLGYDAQAEYQQAEQWLRTTFSLPPETDLSSPGTLNDEPNFRRGMEFWELGLYNLASTEFDALRTLIQNDPAACFRLAQTLVQLGAYRPAILTTRQILTLAQLDDAASLNAPMYFNRIRFGAYYIDLVIPEAQTYNFHPFVVWSLMRQESFFDQTIVSPAGARGLMQIMPATGQELSEQLGWPANYSNESLNLPLVSIKLGLRYLSNAQRYLDGDLFAAMAAYNGGPGNAAAWKELSQNDPDLFLEIIRLDEPRRYIKGIYEMFNIYRRLYGRIPE